MGWIGTYTSEANWQTLKPRLEWILDASLSLSTPIQRLAPKVLASLQALQAPIKQRLRANLRFAESLWPSLLSDKEGALHPLVTSLDPLERKGLSLVTPLWPEGGWSLCFQGFEHDSNLIEDEAWALACIESGVALIPGYFYDMPQKAILVASLIVEPSDFEKGIRLMLSATAIYHSGLTK